MKLSLSLFLLALPSPTLSFAPNHGVAKSRSTLHELEAWRNPFAKKKTSGSLVIEDDDEPKAEAGFTSSILGDQEDDDVIEKERAELLGRIKKGKTPNNVIDKTEKEAQVDWDVKVSDRQEVSPLTFRGLSNLLIAFLIFELCRTTVSLDVSLPKI